MQLGNTASLTRRLWLALFACAVATLTYSAAPTESQIKSVFLFNFSQFVDWPEGVFESSEEPLVIGILGNDPFGQALDEAVAGEVIKGHPLIVRRFNDVGEIDRCHILYVDVPRMRLANVLRSLRGRHILTVSDTRDFARAGGMIELATVGNRIRLHINLEAVKQANLEISSKLLRPARIVGTTLSTN
jgi:hypothetical protein